MAGEEKNLAPADILLLWQLGVSNLGMGYVKIFARTRRFLWYLILVCTIYMGPCRSEYAKCQIYRGDPVFTTQKIHSL